MLQAPPAERLDHDLYAHRRAGAEPQAPWPGGRRSAAFILLRIQSLELEPPPEAQRDPRWRHEFGNFAPDYRGHSLMEYGNRIGVFRLLDLLQPLGWRVAAAVNGKVAHAQPALVRMLQQRQVELVASGWSASRMISSAVPPELERRWLSDSVDALAQASGARPDCYASQDYGYSMDTPALLESLGLRTLIDWPNDERPYGFGPSRKLVMLPAAAEMEDSQMVGGRRLQGPRWRDHLRAGLAYWQAHGLPGSVLALPLHAWISGAPHRHTNLRQALGEFPADSFWQAGPAQIAEAWRAGQAPPA